MAVKVYRKVLPFSKLFNSYCKKNADNFAPWAQNIFWSFFGPPHFSKSCEAPEWDTTFPKNGPIMIWADKRGSPGGSSSLV